MRRNESARQEAVRRSDSRRRPRALRTFAVAFVLLATSVALAEEPLRLLLQREPVAETSECLRGTLSVVRSFSAADIARALPVADFLELPAGEDSAWITAGTHTGVVVDDVDDGGIGWRIEIEDPDAPRALRAPPQSDLGEAEGSVLVGRRAGPAPTGACTLSAEGLGDGDVLMRRLRQIYASPDSDRPIEIRVES